MPRSRAIAADYPQSSIVSRWVIAGVAALGLMVAAGTVRGEEDGIIRSHGYSYFGDLTYPADFEHFDYVNPQAPKGGEIALWAPGRYSRRSIPARLRLPKLYPESMAGSITSMPSISTSRWLASAPRTLAWVREPRLPD